MPPSLSMSLSSKRGLFSLLSSVVGDPMATPISSGRTWSICESNGGDRGLTCQYFKGGEGSARVGGGPGDTRPLTGLRTPLFGVRGGVAPVPWRVDVVDVDAAGLCVLIAGGVVLVGKRLY